MSNPFSSALNYFSGQGSEGGSRFVGQVVDLGGKRKLKVKKIIAEGNSSFIVTLLSQLVSLAAVLAL